MYQVETIHSTIVIIIKIHWHRVFFYWWYRGDNDLLSELCRCYWSISTRLLPELWYGGSSLFALSDIFLPFRYQFCSVVNHCRQEHWSSSYSIGSIVQYYSPEVGEQVEISCVETSDHQVEIWYLVWFVWNYFYNLWSAESVELCCFKPSIWFQLIR